MEDFIASSFRTNYPNFSSHFFFIRTFFRIFFIRTFFRMYSRLPRPLASFSAQAGCCPSERRQSSRCRTGAHPRPRETPQRAPPLPRPGTARGRRSPCGTHPPRTACCWGLQQLREDRGKIFLLCTYFALYIFYFLNCSFNKTSNYICTYCIFAIPNIVFKL